MRTAEATQDASLQCEGLGLQEFQFDAALEGGGRTKGGGNQGIEKGVFGGSDFSGFAESFAQARIVIALKCRQQAGSHAVAEKSRIEVGGVLTKWLAEGVQILFDLPAAGGEQWTDEARRRGLRFVARGRFGGELGGGDFGKGKFGKIEGAVDSGETAGSGATEKAQEDGFRLIVAGVGGGNAVEPVSGGRSQEKRVAGTAAGSFQREMKQSGEGCDILGFDGGLDRQLRSQLANKTGVAVGIRAAKIVVEMEDEEHYAEAGGEFGKGSQQSYGISAAADGKADALAGTNEAMFAQVAIRGG